MTPYVGICDSCISRILIMCWLHPPRYGQHHLHIIPQQARANCYLNLQSQHTLVVGSLDGMLFKGNTQNPNWTPTQDSTLNVGGQERRDLNPRFQQPATFLLFIRQRRYAPIQILKEQLLIFNHQLCDSISTSSIIHHRIHHVKDVFNKNLKKHHGV